MFVLLFVYVFGGAIVTPGFDYVDFLMPGIIVQSIAFGGFVTALGLSEDVQKGLIDRFRSLPMSRAAVLTGRTLSDILLNCLSLTVLLGVGFIAGFNFQDTTAGEVVLGIFLLLLFGYAFSWIFALVGLFSSSPETANSIGFTAIFPLTFASSAFVPAESMPDGLQQFAEANPFTTVVDAVRSLWLGTPANTRRLDGVRVVRRAAGDLRAAGRPPLQAGGGQVAASGTLSRCAFGSSQRPSPWPSRPPRWLVRRARAGAGAGDGGRRSPARSAAWRRVRASGGESTSRSIPAQAAGRDRARRRLRERLDREHRRGDRAGRGLRPRAARRRRDRVDRLAHRDRHGEGRRATAAACCDLVVGDREIGAVKGTKTYAFDARQGRRQQAAAQGLRSTLTDDFEGFPAGTTVVVADVSASARAGATPRRRPRRPPRSRPPSRPRRRARADRHADAARRAAELTASG